MGPSWDFGATECRLNQMPVVAGQQYLETLRNCTFQENASYELAIYVEGVNVTCARCAKDDGTLTTVDRGAEVFNTSNYFFWTPKVEGETFGEDVVFSFQAWQPGHAWCAIVNSLDKGKVSGERVRMTDLTLGGPRCCNDSLGQVVDADAQIWRLNDCGLQTSTSYMRPHNSILLI